MKHFIFECKFHKSYIAENEEQARELFNNDPSIPNIDDYYYSYEVTDCGEPDEYSDSAADNTKRVLAHLEYVSDYNQAVFNSLMIVND